MHLPLDTLGAPPLPGLSPTEVSIFWDEMLAPDIEGSERWVNLENQRGSDLLFLTIHSTRYLFGGYVDGLVLRMLPHFADDTVLCSRMGTFRIDDVVNHALGSVVARLGFRDGDDNFNFTNVPDSKSSTTAVLIQTVAIV